MKNLQAHAKFFILRDKQVIPVDNSFEWAQFYMTHERHVACDQIGDATVSTVFMGVGTPYTKPLLFETMAFRGDGSTEQTRCATWDEAIEQHEAMVARMQAEISGGARE